MKRDTTLDAVKGLAIILVMAGHILETSVADYKTLGLFNIIWAVQMPIFFFLSGYFCEGRECVGGKWKGYTAPRGKLFNSISVLVFN